MLKQTTYLPGRGCCYLATLDSGWRIKFIAKNSGSLDNQKLLPVGYSKSEYSEYADLVASAQDLPVGEVFWRDEIKKTAIVILPNKALPLA